MALLDSINHDFAKSIRKKNYSKELPAMLEETLDIAFIPLLWCFAVHALNHACIADEWLYKVCYCFFCVF